MASWERWPDGWRQAGWLAGGTLDGWLAGWSAAYPTYLFPPSSPQTPYHAMRGLIAHDKVLNWILLRHWPTETSTTRPFHIHG